MVNFLLFTRIPYLQQNTAKLQTSCQKNKDSETKQKNCTVAIMPVAAPSGIRHITR